MVDNRTYGLERAFEFGRAFEAAALPVGFALSCRAENVDARVLEQLKRGGVRHIFVGIESGSSQALKLYGKGHSPDQNRQAIEIIKGLGMSFQAGFMMFNYKSSLADLRRNLDFLRNVGEYKPFVVNTELDPHFGTPIVADMKRKGVLSDDDPVMHSSFLEPRVATAKAIAERIAQAFWPFMTFLATIRSAVTYEWRRAVPNRRAEEEVLIDAFESKLNERFTDVLSVALEAMERSDEHVVAEIMAEAESHLLCAVREAEVGRALLGLRLTQIEGGMRYWTQADLIALDRAHAVKPSRNRDMSNGGITEHDPARC